MKIILFPCLLIILCSLSNTYGQTNPNLSNTTDEETFKVVEEIPRFPGCEDIEDLEKKAFELGGNNYNAPIQRVEDFLENKTTTNLGKIKRAYMPGVTFANLNEILPEFVSNTLKEGLTELDQKLHGFAEHDAIMTGVETRSSSPVQITRDKETMNSINVQGLYPCGEGAGYAGGIMTAAIDGIKCAIKIIEKE